MDRQSGADKLAACGVILAGGQSRRMGVNKALLEFEGEPLIGRLARRLGAWFDQVVVVTNAPELYHFLGLPMATDRIPGLGPLGGLEAGLSLCRHDYAFFVACDMPFVDEGLVRFLLSLAPGYDLVIPQVAGEFEPMHAVYSRRFLPAVSALLEQRRLRLIHLFEGHQVRVVSEAEIRPFGQPERLFFNCNTPDDLARARSLAGESFLK